MITTVTEDGEVLPTTPVNATSDGSPPQLDLGVLADKLSPLVRDPSSDFVSTMTKRPGPAAQTAGPHRYSISVPHDDGTYLNLGAGAHMLAPTGVTMGTKTRVTATATDTFTQLNLGKPTLYGSLVNKQTSGYSLYTNGASNHFADLDVALTSMSGSVTVVGRKDVNVESTTGSLALVGGEHVAMTSTKNLLIHAGASKELNVNAVSCLDAARLLVADVGDFVMPAIGLAADGKGAAKEDAAKNDSLWFDGANFFSGVASDDGQAIRDYVIQKTSTYIDKGLTHLASITSFLLAFEPTAREALYAEPGWQTARPLVAYALSAANVVKAIIADIKGSADPTEGELKLTATKCINIESNAAVQITGPTGVTISGFKGASVSGLSASLKGHKDGSVWGGLSASLKSLAGDTVVSSDLGKVQVSSKKDMKVSSSGGNASFTGENDTQVNSVSGLLMAHGARGAYVGAGYGASFATVVTPVGAALGMVSGAEKFADAALETTKNVVLVQNDGVTLQAEGSKVFATPQELSLNAPKLSFEAANGNLSMEGNKILIG